MLPYAAIYTTIQPYLYYITTISNTVLSVPIYYHVYAYIHIYTYAYAYSYNIHIYIHTHNIYIYECIYRYIYNHNIYYIYSCIHMQLYTSLDIHRCPMVPLGFPYCTHCFLASFQWHLGLVMDVNTPKMV